MKTNWCIALIASMLATFGCEGDTVGGDGASQLLRAEVDLEIGSVDGAEPYLFGRVSGLARDDAGRILVADVQAEEIRVFDARGEFLFTVGRSGSGPGELRGPCCLAFDDEGLLWVRDGFNARYNAYRLSDSSAVYVTSRRMVHGAGNLWVATTFSSAGELIDVGHVTDPDLGPQLIRYFVDSTSQVVGEETVPPPPAESLATYEVEREQRDSRVVFFFPQPYGPRHLVGHSPMGGWAEAVSSVYNIRWYGPQGTFVHDLARELTGPPLSAAEGERARESLERRLRNAGMKMGDLPFGIPDRKTPLQDLRFDSSGRLWAFINVKGGDPRQADVYERNGTFLFTVEWPANVDLRSGYLARKAVLGLSTDSLGVQRVVRLTMPEPAR